MAVEVKQKPNKVYVLRRLWGYMKTYRMLIMMVIVLTVVSNVLALWGPGLAGKAIEAIGDNPGTVDFDKVFYYVYQMLIFYCISSVLSYFLSILMIRITQKVTVKMRKDVFDKLSSLPVEFFDTHQIGNIISTISYDIDTVNASLANDLLQIMKSIITVVGSLIMMLTIAPKLVLVFLVTIPMSVIFTGYITKKVRPLFRRRSAKLGELNGYVEEMTMGQKTTKAFNAEKVIINRFDQRNEEAIEAFTQAEYHGSITGPVVMFISNLSLILVSVFGSLMYLNGGIGLKGISSFVLYSRKFSGPINEIASIFGELQSAITAGERVFRLLDETPEKLDKNNAKVLENVQGVVSLENISFSYDKKTEIIKNLSFKAPKGSVTAIVGKTGAGKTTIINLLMRFYDVDKGSIFIDNNDIYDVTRESLRSSYTMVLQDTWLFYGTIFENVAYGKEGVTREDVMNVCKSAKIHDFIVRLPLGYDTIITDDGINISKGQKQLLTIARAMLLNSNMLILDEATSNVDTRTEQRIQQAMLNLMKDKTCFVIAHRLSTIQHADNILVVKEGNIVEQGSHSQLMKNKGYYSQLYNSQFETFSA